MKLVVGLGNPGSRYARTRHNVGFRVVERFAASHGIALDESRYGGRFGRGLLAPGEGEALDLGVLEPATFMNLSGDAVAAALSSLPIEDTGDLLVVFDDVDLPFGRLRLRPRGGSSGHNGMAHISERLGHSEFPRLRFGVGRPPGQQGTADWVLQDFAQDEEVQLPGLVACAAQAVEVALVLGLRVAMERFNRALAPDE